MTDEDIIIQNLNMVIEYGLDFQKNLRRGNIGKKFKKRIIRMIHHLREAVLHGHIPGTVPHFMKEIGKDVAFVMIDRLDKCFHPLNDPEKIKEDRAKEFQEWEKSYLVADLQGSTALAEWETKHQEWIKTKGIKVIKLTNGTKVQLHPDMIDLPENLIEFLVTQGKQEGLTETIIEPGIMADFMAKHMKPPRGHYYESGKPDKEYWLNVLTELKGYVSLMLQD